MNLNQLGALFLEAKRLSGQSEFVVIGSLSILGVARGASHVHERMLTSVDVNCYTRADPERIFELADALGEGSPFDEQHGYYLDPFAPNLPTLPAQWSYRLVKTELEESITIYFLDPNDAAVSKVRPWRRPRPRVDSGRPCRGIAFCADHRQPVFRDGIHG